MNLGKLAGFKGMASASHSKRRLKSELSTDMISCPLGDFRHTMHVGRGGEVFGDTSFLSNHGGGGGAEGEAGDPDNSEWKATRFFTRTLRHMRRNPPQRMRRESHDQSLPPPPVSPIIKNAISLPQLPVTTPNGHIQGVLFPTSISSPEQPLYSYGFQSGFVTLPRLTRLDRNSAESPPSNEHRRGSLPDEVTLTRSDSLDSFTLDLGPSLMTELLSLIDSSSSFTRFNQDPEEVEEAGEPGSLLEMLVGNSYVCSPAASTTAVPHRDSRGHSCSQDWDQQHTNKAENGAALKRATPDASLQSPVRVEPVIEAERFQQAADVLARHYGGGSALKGRQRSPSTFPEEEEEIKV